MSISGIRSSLPTRALATFVLVVLLALVAAGAAILQLSSAFRTGNVIINSEDALRRLNRVYDDLLDAEAGQRGYLLTGSPEYLEPFNRGRNALAHDLEQLGASVANIPDEVLQTRRLGVLSAAKMDEMAHTIDLVRSNRRADATALVDSGADKRSMDEARATIWAIRDMEYRRLFRSLQLRGRYRTILSGAVAMLSILVILLAASGMWGLGKSAVELSIARERAMLSDIERVNAKLLDLAHAFVRDIDGTILRWTEGAEKLYGYTAAQAVGRVTNALLKTQFPESFEDIARKLTETGSWEGELAHTCKDGRQITVASHWIVQNDENGRKAILEVQHDISDRKAVEAQLERLLEEAQSAQVAAEGANRAKDEFLAVLSHEMRTPLNSAVGWTAVLGKIVTTSQAQRALAGIERALTSETSLVNDLLDTSGIVAGKLDVRLDNQVDLRIPVQQACENFRAAASAKRINLTCHSDPRSLPVLCDSRRLQQVIDNLLSNAVKFTPEGGAIEVSSHMEGDQALVTVADTGAGIEPEFLPLIFDRFRQESTGTTRRYGGLGLGLSIVRHLVTMHRGRIEARSPGRNQGTTFRMWLPLVADRQQLSPNGGERRPDNGLAGLSVLLVEDEDDTRQALRLNLEMSGAEVLEAASTEQALELLEKTTPEAILSDVGFPGEDGLSFIRRVRGRFGSSIACVALSGFTVEGDDHSAEDAGFDAYLLKPVDFETLLSTIERLRRVSNATIKPARSTG